MTDFSHYIVYADESGDHGLVSIDPEYPVFALTFCIIRKENYIDVVDPACYTPDLHPHIPYKQIAKER